MVRTWRENHVWKHARKAALARARGRCEVCGDSEDLEVHHEVPVGEAGYRTGCQHHQENLHVRCPEHHRELDRARRAPAGTATQLELLGRTAA